MSEKISLDYWGKMSSKIVTAEETTNKRIDMSESDAKFISNFVDETTKMLDIGSGSGLVVNKIFKDVKHIIAVETFPGLSKFIVDDSNVMVINSKLEGFNIRREFDVIISTGVTQFFSSKEIEKIYISMFSMLKEDGVVILRAHCGLNEDVFVNGRSKELDCEYFAEFRYIKNEVSLLKKVGFNSVEYQMLEEKYNAWDNTKQFYLVCKKNK